MSPNIAAAYSVGQQLRCLARHHVNQSRSGLDNGRIIEREGNSQCIDIYQVAISSVGVVKVSVIGRHKTVYSCRAALRRVTKGLTIFLLEPSLNLSFF